METIRERVLLSAITGALVLATAATAVAQGAFRGTFTDEWDNPIVGALVIMEPADGTAGSRVETTTDEDGSYQVLNLPPGQWEVEVQADGYYPTRTAVRVSRLSANRPIELELEAIPFGGLFRGGQEYEAEGGTPSVKFDEDGNFEFEDAEGEGEGTYGIVEETAVMIVRDYDGPDDKYSIGQPVVVTFSTDQFLSLTWGDDTLAKK